jgi:hypothetical protein
MIILDPKTTALMVIEAHDNSVRRIFPRIAQLAESDALAFSPP